MVADIEVRILAHVTFRECHPDWDDLLNEMRKGRNKADRLRIFIEHYLRTKDKRRKQLAS